MLHSLSVRVVSKFSEFEALVFNERILVHTVLSKCVFSFSLSGLYPRLAYIDCEDKSWSVASAIILYWTVVESCLRSRYIVSVVLFDDLLQAVITIKNAWTGVYFEMFIATVYRVDGVAIKTRLLVELIRREVK